MMALQSKLEGGDNKKTFHALAEEVNSDRVGCWGGWIRTIDTGSKGPCDVVWPQISRACSSS